MFPGSITIKPESMTAILTDLFVNFKKHGFNIQFIMNHHGDPHHNDALIKPILNAREQEVKSILIIGGLAENAIERACKKASLPLSSPAILEVKESDRTKEARVRLNKSELHIQAEERETSLVMKWYSSLLKKRDEIKSLEPVVPTNEEFTSAKLCGKWRELSPLGYIGDPSVASEENCELYLYESQDMADAIAKFLQQKKQSITKEI